MRCRVPPATDLVPTVDGCARVIEIVPGQVRTRADLPVRAGLVPHIARDPLPAAVRDAYRGAGTGLGVVRGFGLAHGAIASSVAHDAHQVVAVGAEPAAMVEAVETVVESHGGLVAVGLGESRCCRSRWPG